MILNVLEFEATHSYLRQFQLDAANTVRPWLKIHTVTVNRALKWFGVKEREDQAELTQEVFLSAYLTLVRGEQIKSPRVWLWDCAREHASKYRHKAQRQGAERSAGIRSSTTRIQSRLPQTAKG